MAAEREGALLRMKELGKTLREASRAYYAKSLEVMTDREYDRLYDELLALEKETGIVLASSPTLRVGYEAVDALPKEAHEKPMLSLDKTKEPEALRSFLGNQKALLSWKLDGLTVVLTYQDGCLAKAVTRGNGQVGEVITPNARVFENLPLRIPYGGELVLRGEAVILYADFARMNAELGEEEARYKNPRNLCSGSVRQLNSEITAKRHVRFYAFGLVRAEGVDFANSREAQLRFLTGQGFETVEYRMTTAATLDENLRYFSEAVKAFPIPSDGLVALYDDIAYGEALGATAKFPRNAFAFKWQDETAETTLRELEWSASRTGLINPVAIFDAVELEGTTVSRASVHNVSIVKSLALGVGDRLTVYKANMIIPQIAENLTRSGTAAPPELCPVCGAATEIHDALGVETLLCPNPGCAAKKIKRFALFVSRDALNVDGLSEMTLEKLIARGLVHHFADLFGLAAHREALAAMEGFGEKSCENLLSSLTKARRTTLPRLLYGLGIPGIGAQNARVLSAAFGHGLEALRAAGKEALCEVEGVGPVLAENLWAWFSDAENAQELDALLPLLTLEKPAPASAGSPFAGKAFVITGSVTHYENRSALKAEIESLGGKVTGSVSAKTDYLINNDAASASAKNKAAQKLGVPILTEDEYRAMLPQA